MLRNLRFPLTADPATGSLALVEGLHAATQAISAWGLLRPGELLYYGDYHSNLEYNIPRELAEARALEARGRLLAAHPWLEDADVRLLPDEDKRVLTAVLSYQVEGETGYAGFEIGG